MGWLWDGSRARMIERSMRSLKKCESMAASSSCVGVGMGGRFSMYVIAVGWVMRKSFAKAISWEVVASMRNR